MAKYRIAPHEEDKWKVQKRWLGFVWVDVLWLVGYDTYDRLTFSEKENAQKWIEGAIELKETVWRRKAASKARAITTPPEVYPQT